MADGQGFEPWVPVKEHTLSKRAQSTALPPILRSQESSLARVSVVGNFLSAPHAAGLNPSTINHRPSTLTSEPEGFVGEIGGFDDASLLDDHGDFDF
jgi:hypothetical protein